MRAGTTYVGSVNTWDANSYAGQEHVRRTVWLGVNIVDCLEQLLDLVLREDERVYSPILLNIINIQDHAGHNTKVVARAPKGPEQVGVLGVGRCDRGSIGKNNASRDNVVKRESVASLKHTVTSAHEWSDDGYAFAKTRHCHQR